MSGYASLTEKAMLYGIKVLPASTARCISAVGRFGVLGEQPEIVPWPIANLQPGTGISPVTEGSFSVYRHENLIKGMNHAVQSDHYNGEYDIAKITHDGGFALRELNFHACGEQVFEPIENNPFMLVLAPHRVPKPIFESICAYRFDGTRPVVVSAGVWHAPPIPLGDRADFITRQAAVHSCVVYDTFADNGNYYLHIPREEITEIEKAIKKRFAGIPPTRNLV